MNLANVQDLFSLGLMSTLTTRHGILAAVMPRIHAEYGTTKWSDTSA